MLIMRVNSFYQQKKENDMAYQHLTVEERSLETISIKIPSNMMKNIDFLSKKWSFDQISERLK
ncbi:MAG: hypothetical protein HAW62_00550 [Endozoicomonadaceae bacterium]|nr:hypothetical protein [Endozoicomonadaceae bacterium]